MYNLSFNQGQAISADQLRQQIKEQVQQATAEARAAAKDAQIAAREGQVTIQTQTGAPGAPVGVPIVSVKGMPWDADIPPRVKDVSVAFFVMLAVIVIALPIMRAIGKRIERGAPAPMTIPAEMQSQMQQLMQSVDAIAIEVERISEGQRFATKLLTEKKSEA
ncbi:MAG TPA: hypothetical protein VII02_14830 [Gemmatimonadaceae bacterium]